MSSGCPEETSPNSESKVTHMDTKPTERGLGQQAYDQLQDFTGELGSQVEAFLHRQLHDQLRQQLHQQLMAM